MKTQTNTQALATAIAARNNWEARDDISRHCAIDWQETIDTIMETAPSGSGIDCGTKLHEDSTGGRLVFVSEFHHMNEGGYYDGWTEHRIIVTPTFSDFDIRVTGRNRNEIKDYLADVYEAWLSEYCEYARVYLKDSKQ